MCTVTNLISDHGRWKKKCHVDPPWLRGYGKYHLGLSGQHSSCGDNQPFNLKKEIHHWMSPCENALLPRCHLFPGQSLSSSCAATMMGRKQLLLSDGTWSIQLYINQADVSVCVKTQLTWGKKNGVLCTLVEMTEIHFPLKAGSVRVLFCSLPMHYNVTSPSVFLAIHLQARERESKQCALYSSNLAHLPACSFP